MSFLLWKMARRKERQQIGITLSAESSVKKVLRQLLRRLYVLFIRLPLVRIKARSVREQLAPVYSYDEWKLREQTAAIIVGSSLVMMMALGLFLSFEQDVLSWLMLIVLLSVAESLYTDFVIQRAELQLLRQSVYVLADVRQSYHRCRIVESALEEALERAAAYAAPHMQRLLQMLQEPNPDVALAAYEEAAPNRHYKLFAGLSRLVAEYGDPPQQKGSSYLQGISMIVQEMQTEVVLRTKLDYLLKGLKVIAVAPVLFADPLEMWARTHFPTMDAFYDSKLGWSLQVAVFIVVLTSHKLLGYLQWRSERPRPQEQARRRWDEPIWKLTFAQHAVKRWMSRIEVRKLSILHKRLQEANETIPLSRFYLRRLLYSSLTTLLAFVFVVLLQVQAKDWHIERLAERLISLEQAHGYHPQYNARSHNAVRIHSHEHWLRQVVQDESRLEGKGRLQQEISELYTSSGDVFLGHAVEAIVHSAERIRNDSLGWQQMLLILFVSYTTYYVPVWMLLLRIRLKEMEMRTELSQFHSLALLLRAFRKLTAEQLLEWMTRSAVVYRRALERCLLNWESGADDALDTLKKDAPFPDFVRFVDRIALAHNYVPLQEAFDDVDQDWLYEQEMRKQHHERTIDAKAGWGQWIGFAPMYALIFIYLVIPLLWMSTQQMQQSFDQIRQL
ncbi:GTPase SAR1 [Paenibacillus sp. 481]|uniref:GTPase SAR1 n=1 Tax=Paenibacillus sp. 481 TaxID=2835869 RepID=UPI001E52A6A8|nr:GTPase SAR1 [Paenibacillus sp. 481]